MNSDIVVFSYEWGKEIPRQDEKTIKYETILTFLTCRLEWKQGSLHCEQRKNTENDKLYCP